MSKGIDLTKLFSDAFGVPCFVTAHAVTRIRERFFASDMRLLQLLIRNVLRRTSLKILPQQFAVVDDRYGFSVVCDQSETGLRIVTVIRGKLSDGFDKTPAYKGSISQEQSMDEVERLRALVKRNW